jgi:hypothetical protein
MNNMGNDDFLTNSLLFELYKTAYFEYLDNHTHISPSFRYYISDLMTQDDVNKATKILRKSKLEEIFNGEF